MAAIPTYFLFGDKQILGQTRSFMEADVELGIPPGKAYVLRKAIPSLMQQVPSQANGDPASPPAYGPWWDGQYVDTGAGITGRWTIYHHADGGSGGPLTPLGGDNWFSSVYNAGTGISTSTYPTFGATISLMQFLKQRHGNAAPGFKFYKRTYADPVTNATYGIAGANGWGAIAGASWSGFLSELSTMRSRLTGGDTLDLKGIILDAYTVDIEAGTSAATYKTALQTLITRIRAAEGGATNGLAYSGLIILVNPDPNLFRTSRAGLASAYRQVHAEVAANASGLATYNNIRIVEMAGASFAPAPISVDPLAYDNEDPDPDMYSSDEYIALGYRIGVTIEAFYKAAPAVTPGSGLATYFLIGDSQAKGTISPFVATFGEQASILGPYQVGSPNYTRTNQYIWNGVVNLIQPYSVLTNANTLPAAEYTTSSFGPEATFMKRLAEEHGDNGFLVIKIAQNGAALTTEADAAGAVGNYEKGGANLYDTLIAAWNRVKIDMVTPRSGWGIPRVPDVRGIAVLLGDNDTYTAASATAFAAKVGQFITDICTDFRTRTDRTTVPVAWHKIPKGVGEGGQSSLGDQASRTAVRAALASAAASRATYFSLVETDDLELRRDDNIHYAGEANYEIGYRLAEALLSLSATGGATGTGTDTGEDTGEDGPAPEAATLVVEDGSGLTNANSYASLAYADSYHEYHRNPATWSEADDGAKEQALRMATWWLDQTYGDRWIGLKATQEQALDWPRGLAYDRNGYQVPDDEVPNRLKDATCEMALRYLLAPDELMPDVQVQDQGILSESNTVGALSSSTTYAGGKSYEKRFTAAYRLLTTSGLIEGGNWANR